MTDLPGAIALAWRAWTETPRPFENFWEEKVDALSFGVELDLDHQATYLDGLMEELARGNREWHFHVHAQRELRDLEDFWGRIEAIELPAVVFARFDRYAKATRRLLNAILLDMPPSR